MPFVLKKFDADIGDKIFIFLLKKVGLNISNIQKYLNKGRVFDENGNTLKNGDTIQTPSISVAMFEGVTKGLDPLITMPDFALFDKPSGLMVHPISRSTPYSLLDEVKYHFGEGGNIVHRIDAETSGLVLIGRDKKSEVELKMKFENKEYQKGYLAIVRGKVIQNQEIDTPITKDRDSMIRVKMKTSKEGKESFTEIKPIKYDVVTDTTLVTAIPHTGRQHQIRVHLDSIGHTILGDPIYGMDEEKADMYLCKTLPHDERVKLTGANRLLLQADYLEFEYKKILYKFKSKQKLENI